MYSVSQILYLKIIILMVFLGGIRVSQLLFFFVLCCPNFVFTFWVPCCDVRYDFRIKTMFGPSLPPVVCRRVHVLFTKTCTYLCLFTHSGVQHILCCVFVCFYLSCASNVASISGLSIFLFPLRYSLTFISPRCRWNRTHVIVYCLFIREIST